MSTKYESFWIGGSSGEWSGGNRWHAQGFKSSVKHTLDYVVLYCYTGGNRAGNVTVAIYPDDGSGKPNCAGGALASVTVAGSSLPNGTYGNHTFTFSSPPVIQPNVTYHIVMSYTGAGFPTDYYYWRLNLNGGYGNGKWNYSTNGGSSWGDDARGDDTYFEEWGTEVVAAAAGGGLGLLVSQGVI